MLIIKSLGISKRTSERIGYRHSKSASSWLARYIAIASAMAILLLASLLVAATTIAWAVCFFLNSLFNHS